MLLMLSKVSIQLSGVLSRRPDDFQCSLGSAVSMTAFTSLLKTHFFSYEG